MKRLMKLREDKKNLVGTMRGMVEAGDFSPEQDTEYKGHETKLAKINADIEREEALAAQEDQVAKMAGLKPEAEKAAVVAVDKSEKPKFATFGEYLSAVAKAYTSSVIDNRLYGATGMSEGVAPDGGFMVEIDFASQIIEPLYSPGAVLSRCTSIPIGSNSNGVKIPYVDEVSRATGSRWGGVRAFWLAEAGTLTQSQPKLGMLELNLKKLGCLGYTTDELLQDSPAMEGLLLRSFQNETRFTVEDSVFQGDGVGKPLGILNGPSTVSQAIEATQTIANSNTFIALNTLKMISRLPAGSFGNAVWLANVELLPTIATATISGSAGAVPVFIPPAGAQDSPFGTLWGRPILFVEYAAQPGTVGDIVLADLSQYAVATKGGARLDQSMHVKFLTDEMTYRLIYRIDGQPLPRSAVTPYKGALSRSPFVTLAVRS